MNQPYLVTDIPIRGGLERAVLRRKVPGTQQLLKTEVFSLSPQRPTLPDYKQKIPSSQRVIQPTSVERKQPLHLRPKLQPNPK